MTELKRKRKMQAAQRASELRLTLKMMFEKYKAATPVKLKIIDAYSLYACATAAIQLVYVCLVGNFPFNAFLGGFISCIASVVAAVSLRSQINPQNSLKYPNISHEKAFAEFIFFHIVLHLAVINLIG